MSRVTILAMALVLAGCSTIPQQNIVSHATSLPPTKEALPVSCVTNPPDPPTVVIDPNATVKQRYYQMRAAIADLDRYYKEAKIVIEACAAVTTAKETP